MKYISIVLVALLVFAASLLYAQDQPAPTKVGKAKMEMSKETTLNGEVVDVSCYLAHGDKGMGKDHKSCAEACAKAGGPLGILTKDKKLYISVMPDDHTAGPEAKLVAHIGEQVKATGVIRGKGGVTGIMITKVELPAEGNQ